MDSEREVAQIAKALEASERRTFMGRTMRVIRVSRLTMNDDESGEDQETQTRLSGYARYRCDDAAGFSESNHGLPTFDSTDRCEGIYNKIAIEVRTRQALTFPQTTSLYFTARGSAIDGLSVSRFHHDCQVGAVRRLPYVLSACGALCNNERAVTTGCGWRIPSRSGPAPNSALIWVAD